MSEKNIFSDNPLIATFENCLSEKECRYICKEKKHDFVLAETSKGVDNHRRAKVSKLDCEKEIIKKIKDKIHSLSLPLQNLSPMQYIKYELGDYYKEHYDAKFELNHDDKQKNFTFIIYLNDEYTGGETFFPKKNILIRPTVGKLLFFENCLKDTNYVHPLSSHSGNIVENGNKHIIVFWGSMDNGAQGRT
tara:strand:+ start:203 stop:775 length:573 start_codon:yes stop_codon:yes gene_type:complete